MTRGIHRLLTAACRNKKKKKENKEKKLNDHSRRRNVRKKDVTLMDSNKRRAIMEHKNHNRTRLEPKERSKSLQNMTKITTSLEPLQNLLLLNHSTFIPGIN
ncbi:hypothetical protein E2C01_050635 [Portunus trituberculatus]|uniref:Uncharacterized protein n=1 Tax=Portunus trituberculatus TaxID=210409 RepID=A0A5B7G8U3_PORTR|nr:hypothetical protein [Portunus trituberculatus]